jgi:hypothetical protein
MKFSYKSFLKDILKIAVAILPSHLELDDDDSSSQVSSKGGGGEIKVVIPSNPKSSIDSPSAEKQKTI